MKSDIEKNLWKRVNKYCKYLQLVPFVKMIAVCNNLAFGNIDEESDIDLFVVAQSGRLFIVRTLVTLTLSILGVRRHGNKSAGRFCLSFFIDENSTNLSHIALKNDYYLCLWIRYLKPIIDLENYSASFLNTNSWIREYFDKKNLEITNSYLIKQQIIFLCINSFLKNILNSVLGDFLEMKLKKWQINRANLKLNYVKNRFPNADIIISDHILKFHNIDRRQEYNLNWEKKFKNKSQLNRACFFEIIK